MLRESREQHEQHERIFVSTLKHDDMISTPIQEGDAGIIFRADGSREMFSCFRSLQLTAAQLDTSTKLIALVHALKDEEFVHAMIDKAINDGIFDAAPPTPRLDA